LLEDAIDNGIALISSLDAYDHSNVNTVFVYKNSNGIWSENAALQPSESFGEDGIAIVFIPLCIEWSQCRFPKRLLNNDALVQNHKLGTLLTSNL